MSYDLAILSPRSDVLEPIAVVGIEQVARALAERLLAMDDERLSALRGVAAKGLLLALGEGDALPWVDGVTYLGRDPGAPSLLLPTTLRPAMALDLFERAIARHASGLERPLAVLPSPPRVLSVAKARPIERAIVRAWLEASA